MSDYLLSGIGKRIKALRQDRGTTLTDLAEQAGISKGLLSKVENGRTVPSLPVLLSLIRTLGLQPEAFFQDLHFSPPSRYLHVAARAWSPIQKEDTAFGFHYFHILQQSFESFTLEAAILDIDPGSQREKVSTDAYEFKYVLQGELLYQIDEEYIELKAGDTLFYNGRLPHVPHNRSDAPARLLVVYLYDRSDT